VRIRRTVVSYLTNQSGATAVEYGIMVALIAAIIVGVVTILGQDIRDAFCTVAKAIGASVC
jgi:pilus assembly protein Flp/PilA